MFTAKAAEVEQHNMYGDVRASKDHLEKVQKMLSVVVCQAHALL